MKNRIYCFFILFGEAVFHILHVDYFSYYLLLFTVGIIVVDFLASLPGFVFFEMLIQFNSDMYEREKPIKLSLSMKSKSIIPLVLLSKTVVEFENMLSGEKEIQVFDHSTPVSANSVNMSFSSRHYGVVKCTVKKVIVTDLFGLISVNKGKSKAEAMYAVIVPAELLADNHEVMSEFTASVNNILSQQMDLSEDFDIREYRQGDSLSSIHWKLSNKTNKFMVKEKIKNADDSVSVMFNFFGDTDNMDTVIDNLVKFSKVMLNKQKKFAVKWQYADGTDMNIRYIKNKDDLEKFIMAILSAKLPKSGVDLEKALNFGDFLTRKGEHIFFVRKDGIVNLTGGNVIPVPITAKE